MKKVGKLIIYGLIAVAIAILVNFTHTYPLPSWATANNGTTQIQTTIPKRLNITVNISDPDDLKVSEGERVAKGDVIADSERERTRLIAQQKQLQLSLDRIGAASITPPLSPQAVPPTMALPPISYL